MVFFNRTMMPGTTTLVFLVLFTSLMSTTTLAQLEIPCIEFHPRLDFPCLCGLNDINATRINCDGVAFREFPFLPFKFYIQEFQQQHAGLQTLGAQLFTASELPLRSVDFSNNQLRRLTERLFDGVEDTIEVIKFGNNLLGDNLDPVFTTGEFRNLKLLRQLDLSYNMLTVIEEGLLDGCTVLKDVKLNGNKLNEVPTEALRGPESLQNLDLQDNFIERLTPLVFSTQTKLLSVNLTNNLITDIQKGAFTNMTRMVRLILTRNKITRIGDHVLSDLENLVELDLSLNFLSSVPVQALGQLRNLKFLNLGSNHIQTIKDVDLQALESLEYINLSRNLIREIMPGTFLGMPNLKGLDFSVNAVIKVEDDAFEGLLNLEYLDISDNKVLSLPAAALGRLPQLKRLKADYNRIGALSEEILKSVKGLEELSLAYNIIREIPKGTFGDLTQLKILNLFGNQIAMVDQTTFAGAEKNLEYLDLGFNIIKNIETDLYLPALKYLNLAKNNLSDIEGAFNLLSSLNVLNLRENTIDNVTPFTFNGLDNLISIDLSQNLIRTIVPQVFRNNYLNEVNISANLLKELEQDTFVNLPILEVLDLSHNNLVAIKNGAFNAIPRLKKLLLHHNRLSSYKGDFYANMENDTDLHTLDLSYNELTYLYPESFIHHPQLTHVDFSNNKFSFFPVQFIKGLKYLKELKLNRNLIKVIDEEDFANLISLQDLDMSYNDIAVVKETAFQNSSQLQRINLSHNKIAMLKTNTFLGTIRLMLDLSHNNLTDLPKHMFQRPNVMKLQSIDLSHNRFPRIPVDVLQDQYFTLDTLKISNNNIEDIPSDANILLNIKEIDLSYNPLTEDSISNVLNEPKTVRRLNMAGTGIETVPFLETPFLTHLNLSHNDIGKLNGDILNKAALQVLDVSNNRLPSLSFGLTSAWPKLKDLKYLDISSNPISYIIKGDFQYLDTLQVLKMSHLTKCTKIETGAFQNLKALRILEMYDLPMLLYMDIKGILSNFMTLEEVIVDFKGQKGLVGDHLSPAYSARLRKLGVKGTKVLNIAIGAFAGISSPNIDIMLKDTQISNIPTAIFFPVPMSSNIQLDVTGSRLSSLGPQLLNTLDSKQRHIRLQGLGTNPIYCDCNARSLQRWLKEKTSEDTLYADLTEVRCAAPDVLAGKLLADLPDEELTCDPKQTTTTTTEYEFMAGNVTTTPEPDIITSSDLDNQRGKTTPRPNPRSQPTSTKKGGPSVGPYNMDHLIIGIVGGVVVFIAIIIVIICVVRLRLTDSQYRGGPLAGPLALRAQGKCTCLKPVPPTLYGAASMHGPPPPPALSYPSTPVPPPHHPHALALTWAGPPANGTVNSSKMAPPAPSIHGGSAFGTVGAHSYLSAGTVVSRGSHHPISYPGTLTPAGYPSTPYYVTFPADSDGEGPPMSNGRSSGHR